MNRLGIKYQLLLIALIPIFLIDLFFTYTYFDKSIEQANELLQSKGQIIAKQIGGASEFNLISGNDQQIKYLLDQTIDTNAVVLASVRDRQGNVIAESISDLYRVSDMVSYFYYRNPIMSQSLSQPDVFAPDQTEGTDDTTIGWVHLYVSRKQLEATKSRVTRDSIIFFVMILLLAVVLTAIISRRITQPIFALLEHLKHVETGRLGETIEPLALNEIGAVQKGFNRMTQALLSNRKQLNNKIQQATQQLVEAISDMEDQNREIGYARDEAQNANRIKSEFLANMSHEIRTPINGIKGFISLISQSGLNPTQKKYADIVLKSTADLTDIINEILDFSKMESGKLQIVDDEFDLHEIIEQTRDSLFITVLAKNIDLNLIIFSDTPRYVSGDKLRVKQILLNLIGNAIKFTDQGAVVIRVSVDEQSSTEATILITVEDTGIGISGEDQTRLFTAFSQVETAANRRFTGTGLGLAISKNLVSLMGGDISIRSEVDKGSTFSLRLPLALTNKENQRTAQKESPTKTALIVASRKTCLQELQSLYDRAGIVTEPVLLEQQTVEQIAEIIHQNFDYIDYLVIDFRHLDLDLTGVLDAEEDRSIRMIAMHYDPALITDFENLGIEFVSIINTSSSLQKLLDKSSVDAPEEVPDEQQSLISQAPREILLVDDNEINLKLGGKLIQLWGHEVYEANHANEAMVLYRSRSFDLIILDIQMPDIDGVTLMNMMRKERPDNRTPIVALTANILNREEDRLLRLGFDYYLSKPIDEEKFRALIENSPEETTLIPGTAIDQQSEYSESVNIAQSLDLAANNASLLVQIFEILLRDIPHHKDQLAYAALQLDYAKLSSIVHKVHGITCYTSLPRLRALVVSIQQQLAQESYSLIATTVTEMIEEFEQIRLQVESYLQQAVDEVEEPDDQEIIKFN